MESNHDTNERLAILETRMQTVIQELGDVRQDTKDIKQSLNNQRGFIGGALAVLTPIWAVLIVFADKIWGYLTQ